ncbi:gamma-glutamyltransferase [Bradyrhizobium sp. 179]|uniref:gamma-glutamyltransferase family protein n=1 Tax=Bradyrhizobium sp. 179 TaxID=2782648 RepID=UPI001FF9B3BE|nr:gamma-glutamyltransferase [Bradyrhizobium sp. 179]MCK1540531.1 gamma-glutamyltransferase [Bradyrhizobium sp. 179]
MSIDSLSGLGTVHRLASMRPTIAGTSHVVSAGHYLAAQSALQIIESGGNAIDAGVAAGLVLGVVQSELVNVAGVAPIILYLAERDEVITISGLGCWPRALDPDLFMREHGGAIPEGVLRTVVPAAPDAWITALALYGTMSFSEVAQSAIGFARDGFVMYPLMAELLHTYADSYARWPSSAAIYLPGGRPPEVGDLFVQSDLGRTLQYMADCETAARGRSRVEGLKAARDAFYRGDIARTIVAFHEENGGLLSMRDLADFHVGIEPAVSAKFRGSTMYACGPWCQGPALLQMLTMLAGVDLASLGHNSSAYVHTLVETIKLSFADRHRYFGDPRFTDVPLGSLLDPAYAASRRELIDPHRAWPDLPPAGELGGGARIDGGVLAAPKLAALDTSYLAVIDRRGNVFSATPSDVSYDTPVVTGTGLCPSSRGSQSWADPRHPSGVAPGKRPRLTPAPFLARAADGAFTAMGTPGGDVQLQALLQVWLNLEVFGMPPQAAVEAARFASYSFPDSFEPHAAHPGRLNIEGRLGPQQISDLRMLGHDVTVWPDWAWRAGAVCVARQRPEGTLEAAADPRRPAYALGR